MSTDPPPHIIPPGWTEAMQRALDHNVNLTKIPMAGLDVLAQMSDSELDVLAEMQQKYDAISAPDQPSDGSSEDSYTPTLYSYSLPGTGGFLF